MRFRRTFVSAIVLFGAVAVGCSSTQAPQTEAERMANEYEGAPDWVVRGCSALSEDPPVVCGVGSSSGLTNIPLSRSAAESRGRVAISRTLQARIEAMLLDYQKSTSGERRLEASNEEQQVTDVAKQVTEMTLSGTEPRDSWVSPNGAYYSLVVLDADKFRGSLAGMSQLSADIRDAISERADASFRQLEEEIDRSRQTAP